MRVLLTGAAGFIGSHVAEALAARGDEVVAFDRFDDFLYPAEVKRAHARDLAALPRLRWVEADLLDAAAVGRALDGVDVVCHLAALAGVRPSLAEPGRYLRTNVEGTAVVLEAMRAAGCARLVLASSSSVYGARPGADLRQVAAFHEDEPCLTPASPYAASKRMAELLCSTHRDLWGTGTWALRFFTVYGPRQRPDMAIHKFTRAIASGRPITVFGDGSTRRDYTFIADIVAGVVAAIDRVRPGDLVPLNLGGSATIGLGELIAAIETTVGKAAIVDRQPDQPGDVPVTSADLSRARTLLGYAPRTPLADGLAAFWTWLAPRLGGSGGSLTH